MKQLTILNFYVLLSFSLILKANVETHHLPQEWGNQLAYNVSLPDDYDSRLDWPLMLYFHGNGGQGTNGQNKPPASSLWKEKVVLIAPQSGPLNNNNWWQKDQREAAKDILDYELSRLNINPDKIIIIGQSMGGYCSFLFARDYPQVPSAVVPISGGWGNFNGGSASTSGYPSNMTPWNHIPYWIFHGKNDNVVRIASSEQAYDLMTEDGIHTKFTTYINQGHKPRHHIYNSQMFYDWAFAQDRNTPHNFQLCLEVDDEVIVVGYFEEGTRVSISTRQADTMIKEYFSGWTSSSEVYYEDSGGAKNTVSYPSENLGFFENTKSQNTEFIMGNSDTRITANYRRLPNATLSMMSSEYTPGIQLIFEDSEDFIIQSSYDLKNWTDLDLQTSPHIEGIENRKFFRLKVVD
jgi:dienelactone hydrolase